MKKIFSKVPTFVLGAFVGVALTSATVVGAASYLKATVYNVKIIVDGKETKLSDKPLNVNGKTYLPVRDTANALGYGVSGVSSTKIELKSGATPSNGTNTGSSSNSTGNQTGSNNNTSKPDSKGVYVKNLKETYSTDGKLDATKIREALNSGKLDVNAQDEETGNTLLHYVILENNYNAYTAIKRNALNPDVQNNDGDTPLHTTIKAINVFFLSELIGDLKADAEIKNKENKKAIEYTKPGSSEEIELKVYMM